MGAAPLSGVFEGMRDSVYAVVRYEGDQFPIATDIEQLRWDDQQKEFDL